MTQRIDRLGMWSGFGDASESFFISERIDRSTSAADATARGYQQALRWARRPRDAPFNAYSWSHGAPRQPRRARPFGVLHSGRTGRRARRDRAEFARAHG